MDIYPFFLECSKFYNDPQKRKQLQRLAFGHGGLIFIRKTENVLITQGGEFIIPNLYSDIERDNMEKKLWCDDNSEFFKMQQDIQDARKTWVNSKKKDKLRLIDKYTMTQQDLKFCEILLLQSIVKLAMILKLIKIQDVLYKNFEIVHIDGDFNENYFDDMNFIVDFTTLPKSNLKNIWAKVLKSKGALSVITTSSEYDED